MIHLDARSRGFGVFLQRRYSKPRCSPGNKNCGKVCIPQEYSCGDEESETEEEHPETRKSLASVESEIRNDPIESASAVDPKTGLEMFRYEGTKDSVYIPPKEYPRLKGKILTHNHPNIGNWPPSDPRSKGFSFSPADISVASQLRVKEIRAVTSGYDHSMIMPPKPVNIQREIGKHSYKTYKTVLKDVKSGKISPEAGDVEYWHLLWTTIARETPGMTYRRSEVKRDSLSPMAMLVLEERARNRVSFDSGITVNKVNPSQVKRMTEVLLGRSYGKNIDAVHIKEVRDGKITGRFRDRTRIMEFVVSDRAVSTRMVKDFVGKSDSIRYETTIDEEDERFDAERGSPRGVKCGKGWISSRKTCQIGIKQITTPRERQQLALALATPYSSQGGGTSIEDDPAATIRDLQREAREQGIPYANQMSKNQLRDTIRAYKSSPKAREATYRALSKKRKAEFSVTNSQFAKDWKTANRMLKMAGSGGVVTGVAIAAILANRTTEEISRTQASYAANVPAGAEQARRKGDLLAKSAAPLDAGQSQMLFVVGGATGEEGRSKDIVEQINKIAEQERQDKAKRASNGLPTSNYDYAFADYLGNPQVTRIQTFDPVKTDFDVKEESKYDKKGNYKKGYLGRLGMEGAALGRPDLGIRSKIIRRFTGGRPQGGNEDSIDIAAQIYAHANAVRPSQQGLSSMEPDQVWDEVRAMNKNMPDDAKYPNPKKKADPDELKRAKDWLVTKGWVGSSTPNKEKPIRIIAYGHGGKAVKEAMELLHAMGNPDRQILDQITVTYISTPDFNFTQPRAREASFISNQDPFSAFAHRSPERIVGGNDGPPRSVRNYFSSDHFRSGLSTWMGFDEWSRVQRTAEAQAAESKRIYEAEKKAEARKKAAQTRAAKKKAAKQAAAEKTEADKNEPQSPPKRERKKRKKPAVQQPQPAQVKP